MSLVLVVLVLLTVRCNSGLQNAGQASVLVTSTVFKGLSDPNATEDPELLFNTCKASVDLYRGSVQVEVIGKVHTAMDFFSKVVLCCDACSVLLELTKSFMHITNDNDVPNEMREMTKIIQNVI